MEVINLFDWGYIKRCITAHEAQFGSRPTHISVPLPPKFKILDVIVSVHNGDETITADAKHMLHHSKMEHPPEKPTLTAIK